MADEPTREEIEGRFRKLRDEIADLPTAEKLRLAAGFLDAGLIDMAKQVVARAEFELTRLEQ